jgi:hypothetical protein
VRESQVAVTRNHQRRCSDGFELRYDNGQPLRVLCDGLLRGMMSGPASAGGPYGNRVKDQALMEYALAGMGQNLFVSRYQIEIEVPAKAEIEAFLQQQLQQALGKRGINGVRTR